MDILGLGAIRQLQRDDRLADWRERRTGPQYGDLEADPQTPPSRLPIRNALEIRSAVLPDCRKNLLGRIQRHAAYKMHVRHVPLLFSTIIELRNHYRAPALTGVTTAGAGLPNLAASMVTFACTSVSSTMVWPLVQVTTERKGSWTPATSR